MDDGILIDKLNAKTVCWNILLNMTWLNSEFSIYYEINYLKKERNGFSGRTNTYIELTDKLLI